MKNSSHIAPEDLTNAMVHNLQAAADQAGDHSVVGLCWAWLTLTSEDRNLVEPGIVAVLNQVPSRRGFPALGMSYYSQMTED